MHFVTLPIPNKYGHKAHQGSQWTRRLPPRITQFMIFYSGFFVEATFFENGVAKTAYYDENDNLLGTTTNVDLIALPEKARDHINKEYPGYSIEKVVFFGDNEANDTDMSLFNQSVEDEDNYFPLLVKGSKEIILKVSPEGDVSFFGNFK